MQINKQKNGKTRRARLIMDAADLLAVATISRALLVRQASFERWPNGLSEPFASFHGYRLPGK